jgi:pyruvate kinase
VAIMQDLQGPKIRVGELEHGGPVRLDPGQTLTITTQPTVGTAQRVSCTYTGLAHDVRPGDRILLDDGRLRLTVLDSDTDEVTTRVEEGGLLAEHKGINLPGVAVSSPALTDKDRADLTFGLQELHTDFVALSFIRAADEVREAQELVRQRGVTVPLIVKLEKGEAIDNLESILEVADGVMVARGDLGVELAPEQVPMLQKRIIRQANARGIPVITATQMLESMVTEETPTRAEATDVANAVWDGSDAVMLSAESATGRHPVHVVKMMDRIVRAAESADDQPGQRFGRCSEDRPHTPEAAVTHAARVLAEDLNTCAIVSITRTGLTAELFSHGRARVPIYAFSPDQDVCRRLALWWGVTPVYLELFDDLERNVDAMEQHLLSSGVADLGDPVVLTGAYPFKIGYHTNFVKLQTVGEPQTRETRAA